MTAVSIEPSTNRPQVLSFTEVRSMALRVISRQCNTSVAPGVKRTSIDRVSLGRRLCRPHPEGRKASRSARAGTDKVRTRRQPEDCEIARHRGAPIDARADEVVDAAVHESAWP